MYKWFILVSLFCTGTSTKGNSIDINNPDLAEQLYIKLYQRKRAEQLETVKSMRKLSYEKQSTMITLMAEKVFTVILESRATIEASSFIPGVSPFPTDDKVKNALSTILENTALFSEIVLRYPDITVSVLKINNTWDVLLQWSVTFTNQVKYLLGQNTAKLLHLVSQELNHVERNPEYVNPYRIDKQKKPSEENYPTIKKKKKELKKKPRMTNFEL